MGIKSPKKRRPKVKLSEYHHQLLNWYDSHKRNFFWRQVKIGAFKIIVSEILLQRTPADRVEEVVKQLLTQYPAPQSLLEAPIEDLEIFLQPLGLFRRRAKVLHELAKEIFCRELI